MISPLCFAAQARLAPHSSALLSHSWSGWRRAQARTPEERRARPSSACSSRQAAPRPDRRVPPRLEPLAGRLAGRAQPWGAGHRDRDRRPPDDEARPAPPDGNRRRGARLAGAAPARRPPPAGRKRRRRSTYRPDRAPLRRLLVPGRVGADTARPRPAAPAAADVEPRLAAEARDRRRAPRARRLAWPAQKRDPAAHSPRRPPAARPGVRRPGRPRRRPGPSAGVRRRGGRPGRRGRPADDARLVSPPRPPLRAPKRWGSDGGARAGAAGALARARALARLGP